MRFASHLVAIVSVAVLSACSAVHSAAFLSPDGVSIAIELRNSHPTLAEYDRKVIFANGGRRAVAIELARDTGGYAAANLYRCSPTTYMIDSYGERLFIDAKAGTIKEGECRAPMVYLGVFDGGGSKPWRFFTAEQRAERELRMFGG